MWRVFGWMRPATHPNRPPLHVGADELLDCNHFLRVRILFLPQAELERTAIDVRNRIRLALMLEQRPSRDVPGVGVHARGLIDWQPQIISPIGPWNTIDLVLVIPACPSPQHFPMGRA